MAAGSGTRFGGEKQFATLLGRRVVDYSLDVMQASEYIETVALVVPPNQADSIQRKPGWSQWSKIGVVIGGGVRRRDSVHIGADALIKVAGRLDFILVHDGGRPIVDEAIVERAVTAVKGDKTPKASVAAVPVKDTVKLAYRKQLPSNSLQVVRETLDRNSLYAVQTPQIFGTSLLMRAHSASDEDVTDDAKLVERLGEPVSLFEGDYRNIKITTPEDIRIAEALLDSRSGNGRGWRCGTGFDSHRLIAGGKLRLGGMDVPFDMRLDGHSDGDVLLHAVASSVLGGAGIGDLGRHFPSSDDRWKDANSALLLRISLDRALENGWMLQGLDATVIAQRPRLINWLSLFEKRIAEITRLPLEAVNVKATSTDKLGAIGAGEGIAAMASSSMYRR